MAIYKEIEFDTCYIQSRTSEQIDVTLHVELKLDYSEGSCGGLEEAPYDEEVEVIVSEFYKATLNVCEEPEIFIEIEDVNKLKLFDIDLDTLVEGCSLDFLELYKEESEEY